MELSPLTAISPIDGRYRGKTQELEDFFSEAALIRYRVLVEVEYFISLCKIPLPQLAGFNTNLHEDLRKLYNEFSLEDAKAVKEIENITNHDVKAVEYFIKEAFDRLKISEYKEFIHFGLTSQDINNTATPLMIKESIEEILAPIYMQLVNKLVELKEEWADVPLLARTHGQAASPTRLGKEVLVFIERLEKQIGLMNTIPFSAKFGGATGNFNAHHLAYPEIDWIDFSNTFVDETLGLDRSQVTTQIEHYDNLAALFDNMKRINNILIDLCRDVWTYVSMDYFKQKIKKGEVGSSAMPHKVNPIDFENAEGNFGIANAIYEHLAAKLPISRLQRDLTDSTVLRNVGVPMAHSILGFKSMLKGLNKLILNQEAIAADLEANWAVVAEAIQTILRREGYPKPYEALKGLTRTNEAINQKRIANFIDTLDISDELKTKLKLINPSNYTGIKSL
ncbi:MAG: adenylosuccinate lyase [Flavobacteriales bacterium]|nr:adenylosuccinate lyase [Flavobacteriales bacterium]|tara:strand:- start:40067 stop:41419 length:1353 start_codon:yes stop_codon:yes gene_type:complete